MQRRSVLDWEFIPSHSCLEQNTSLSGREIAGCIQIHLFGSSYCHTWWVRRILFSWGIGNSTCRCSGKEQEWTHTLHAFHLLIPILHWTSLLKPKFKNKMAQNFKMVRAEHSTRHKALWAQSPVWLHRSHAWDYPCCISNTHFVSESMLLLLSKDRDNW